MNSFTNPLNPDNSKAKDLLKKWLSVKLKLAADAQIDIIEYQCADPGCLHSETVFHVSDAFSIAGSINSPSANIQVYKINKPLVFIRKWDIDSISLMNPKTPYHKH